MQTAKFTAQPETKVFSEDGRRIEPGSGEMGMVAAGGNVPLGYFKDPEKSANTFKVIDGVRYSFPGDWGYIEADGTLTLLGRGSQCINTGGEKVYPEEVEEAVKLHDAIEDCLVVGVPDEKFGERIVAGRVRRRRGQRRRGRRHRDGEGEDRRVQGAEAGRHRRARAPRPERQGRLQDRQAARRRRRHLTPRWGQG